MKGARFTAFAVAGALALAGAAQVCAAGWIHGKAYLAQYLIASSWADAPSGGVPRRPWPGADLRPIARLTVPGRPVSLYVLDGASPRSLAFGPAHVEGTALPGSSGNSVIVAHRDTHFSFLRDLRLGEELDVEAVGGARARYVVRDVSIVDKHATRVLDPADQPQLTLITCWPFDALAPGSPLRFVVIAERMS
jgi:sortase A